MKYRIFLILLSTALVSGCTTPSTIQQEKQQTESVSHIEISEMSDTEEKSSQTDILEKSTESNNNVENSEESVAEILEISPEPPPISALSSSTPVSASSGSQSSSAKKFFSGTSLTIYDWQTPAVSIHDSQRTGTSFVDVNGNKLGTIISGKVDFNGTGYSNDVQGVLDAFNDYRDIERQVYQQGITSETKSGTENSTDSTAQSKAETVDRAACAQDVIQLVNKERAEAGLNELEVDSEMMELAVVRAKELAAQYDHERPDGTRVSQEYRFGEIINRKTATPKGAVTSWMDSTGHRNLILAEKYNLTGAACYQDENGNFYWVQFFSK